MAWNKHLKTQVNNEIQEGVSINSPDADCRDNDPSKSWFRRSPGLPKRGGGESTNWKWKNLCSTSEVKLLDHSCTQWNILRNSIGLLMHVSYCVYKYIYILYMYHDCITYFRCRWWTLFFVYRYVYVCMTWEWIVLAINSIACIVWHSDHLSQLSKESDINGGNCPGSTQGLGVLLAAFCMQTTMGLEALAASPHQHTTS